MIFRLYFAASKTKSKSPKGSSPPSTIGSKRSSQRPAGALLCLSDGTATARLDIENGF
jgi:hypothetical protein